MEISANGDAPGANQMVEGPVIDPTTMILYNLLDFGESLGNFEFVDNFDIVIMIKIVMMMFLMTFYQSTLMLMMTLSILERICSMIFKCANLILIGAAVTMGMMYVKRYSCPEAQTSFWNLFGLTKNNQE